MEVEDEEPAESPPSPGPEDTADLTTVPDYPSPHSSSGDTNEARNFDRSVSRFVNGFTHFWVNFDHRSDNNATRMGKVTIIRDIGAVTCV